MKFLLWTCATKLPMKTNMVVQADKSLQRCLLNSKDKNKSAYVAHYEVGMKSYALKSMMSELTFLGTKHCNIDRRSMLMQERLC